MPAFAGIEDPFSYFQVYSAGDIGTSTSAYGSDSQGTVGAGGSVYLTSYSANSHLLNEYGLHAGGNATLVYGSYYGNTEVGGNLTVQSLDMNGDVYVGGNFTTTSGGTINGNLSASGTITKPEYMFNVTGTAASGQTYSPVVNFDSVTTYFKGVSSYLSGLDDTTGYSNNYGNLTINIGSGLNIVTMSASEFNSAYGLTVSGSSSGILIINLTGETAELDSTTLAGIDSSKVLLNYFDTSSLNLTGGNTLNVLAINAATNFVNGHINGNLIVSSLTGNGQVNEGYFDAQEEVIPEPATLALLGLGGIILRRSSRPRPKK